MHIYDLAFSDGKTCRSIVLEPMNDPAEELRTIAAVFKPGYLLSAERVIAPPPERMPWKRSGKSWMLHNFELMKNAANGEFILTWPGGALVSKDRDEISAAVRANWSKGC